MPASVPPRRFTATWILYDLANTAFSFNILSFFFPVWLNQTHQLDDSVFAIGTSISMAIVFVAAPFLGALSDRARRRMPFLITSTLVCVVMTAVIGTAPWQTAIVFFVVANIGFQGGLIFYDALLPLVSTPKNRARVASLGVGVGYLGSFVGLGLGRAILSAEEGAYGLVFAATAGIFLLVALPLFFVLREPRKPLDPNALTLGAHVRATLAAVVRIARGRDVPHVGRFLVGRALYADAANTMIIFMGVYAITETGLSAGEASLLLAIGIAGSAVVAPLWGLLADRIGAKNTLDVVLLLWIFTLTVIALVPVIDLEPVVLFPAAFFLGAALGGLWSTDRPLLLALSPPERVGEFFGLYAMVGRFAAILGPLAWALIVDGLNWGRPAAVFSLAVFVAAAYAILRRVPDPGRPGPTPMAAYLPWRRADGYGEALPRLWLLRWPAHALYIAVASVIFFAYRADSAMITEDTRRLLAYQIPDLFADPLKTLMNMATAPWLNVHIVQYVYVLVLLLLFGVWLEIREGTIRAVVVFYATSITAGVGAGALLHVLRAFFDAAWIDQAWDQLWSGGSPGAFGLMGALAARARRPWFLLALFTAWELNVGIFFLQSYTPAFHITAMATGYAMARYWLRWPKATAETRGTAAAR